MTAGPPGPARLSPHNAPSLRRIVLTGFMGAGKSTVGRILAARLGWRFYDTDSLITAQHGISVAEIFAQHGEPHFRRLESEAIATALHDPAGDSAVIALGGGAIETDSVRALLFPDRSSDSVPATVTIYLAAPLLELLARCHPSPEAPVRPLLAAAESPEDRLNRRLPHYRRAHLTVETGGIPAIAVVDRILAWLSTTTAAIDPPTRSS